MTTVDHLIHIYRKGSQPFRSLSALSNEAAIEFMRGLYVEGSVFWERFKDPADYLQERRMTEAWLYREFVARGGSPQQEFPIYLIFGWSKWLQNGADARTLETTDKLEVPLAKLREDQLSFTYPDSMIMGWMAKQNAGRYNLSEFHGKVFRLSEMRAIVEARGLPGEQWGNDLPAEVPNYIEAQVWNREALVEYYERLRAGDG
jgi:hypothetical protein